jgi:hypothetical protein
LSLRGEAEAISPIFIFILSAFVLPFNFRSASGGLLYFLFTIQLLFLVAIATIWRRSVTATALSSL